MVFVATAVARANESSSAEHAPCPMSGEVLWAASPRIATRPLTHVWNGAMSQISTRLRDASGSIASSSACTPGAHEPNASRSGATPSARS